MFLLKEVAVCIAVISTPYAPQTYGPCYPVYPGVGVETMQKCENLGAIIGGIMRMKVEMITEQWEADGKRIYPPFDPTKVTCQTKKEKKE